MAEAAEPNPKFDCPEGLKCPEGIDGDNLEYGHDRVKFYDYITNDEFKKNAKVENGVCVNTIIHINFTRTPYIHKFHNKINEEEEIPYLWQTYHLYTIKMPPCNSKLEGKRSLNCFGYLKDKG